ncbi:unnamed protein product [Effrenium voratum]|nr:unnamed protein product [Effrenium voratum]
MAVVGDGSWPCSGGRCGGWQPWHMWHWLSISGWSAVDGLVTWSGADIPAQAKARTVKNVTVAAGMIDENGPGETGPVIMIVALAAMAEIVAEGAMTVTVEEGGTTAGAGATALAPSGPAAGRAAIGEETGSARSVTATTLRAGTTASDVAHVGRAETRPAPSAKQAARWESAAERSAGCVVVASMKVSTGLFV